MWIDTVKMKCLDQNLVTETEPQCSQRPADVFGTIGGTFPIASTSPVKSKQQQTCCFLDVVAVGYEPPALHSQ